MGVVYREISMHLDMEDFAFIGIGTSPFDLRVNYVTHFLGALWNDCKKGSTWPQTQLHDIMASRWRCYCGATSWKRWLHSAHQSMIRWTWHVNMYDTRTENLIQTLFGTQPSIVSVPATAFWCARDIPTHPETDLVASPFSTWQWCRPVPICPMLSKRLREGAWKVMNSVAWNHDVLYFFWHLDDRFITCLGI